MKYQLNKGQIYHQFLIVIFILRSRRWYTSFPCWISVFPDCHEIIYCTIGFRIAHLQEGW